MDYGQSVGVANISITAADHILIEPESEEMNFKISQ